MHELVPITQIDLAVHFDYRRASSHDVTTDDAQIGVERNQRLQKCIERLIAVAENPQAVVFYFSSFLKYDKGRLQKDHLVMNQPAYLQDIVRILKYQALLGKRFFLWANNRDPDKKHLTNLLQSRGFTFEAEHTTLSAYGEYLDWCVSAKKIVIQKALGLKPANCHLLANLSKT